MDIFYQYLYWEREHWHASCSINKWKPKIIFFSFCHIF